MRSNKENKCGTTCCIDRGSSTDRLCFFFVKNKVGYLLRTWYDLPYLLRFRCFFGGGWPSPLIWYIDLYTLINIERAYPGLE